MNDIFDNPILCKNCDSRMKKATLSKNGFFIRAVICDKCGHRILHPNDEAEYNQFTNLRNKEFRVKMRLVGNSYSVSIPKEIVSFMREQERIMDDMVKLCFEEAGRLSLSFNNQFSEELNKKQEAINLKQNKNLGEIKEK
jgi:hypothetical protein